MEKLTKAEEQLMGYIWNLEKAFMKDLLESYPEPMPGTTTVSTLLKRMADKGFVGYKTFGNSREYYPLVDKSVYFSNHLKGFIEMFFNSSPSRFASFFTRETDLTAEELKELKDIVDTEIQKKEQ